MKKSLRFIAPSFGTSYEGAAKIFEGVEPDGYSKSEYSVPVYDDETIEQVAKDTKNFQYFDWYCDNCNDYLNWQSGFEAKEGTWTCTKCGHVNHIDTDNII